MFEFRLLDGPQTKEVIELITHLHGINKADLLAEISQTCDSYVSSAGYAGRQDFPENWKFELGCFVSRQLARRSRATIHTFLQHTVGTTRSVLGDLQHWIKEAELSVPKEFETVLEIREQMTFLVLRVDGKGELKIAPMTVDFDRKNQIWPRFKTLRQNRRGKSEELQGMMFQLESYVYSVGKVSRRGGIRLAKLSLHARKTDERGNITVFDLYGIRLGHSKDLRRPFAHPVYAYLLEPADQEKLDRLLHAKSFDELAATKVFTHDELIDMQSVLEQERLIDGGLLIEEMLDGA